MLTHSSPEVQEAFLKRQRTTGHEEIWATSPGALWRDGYITGREEGHADQSLFIVKAALQEIAREVGVDVNLDSDLEAATFQSLIETVRATVARAIPAPWFQEFQKQHDELDSAYHRLRDLADATHLPNAWNLEEPLPARTWSWTEARLRTIVEERDRLKAAIEAVRSATEQAG